MTELQPDAAEGLAAARDEIEVLESLYQTAPIGLALLGTDLRYVKINRRLAELNGRSVADHLGRSLHEILPDIADQLEPLLRGVIETGEPILRQEVSRALPEEPEVLREWIITYYPVGLPDGRVSGIGVIVEEITQIKKVQRALAESEHRLRTLIDNADLVLWAVDREGIFTLSEGKGLELLGHLPGEVVGTSIFDLYADHPEIVEATRRALAGEPMARIVEIGEAAFDSRWLPVGSDADSPDGAIGVALDVTDRQKAVRDLEESEQRFRDISDNMREVFWLFDRNENRTVYLGPAFESIWGRPDCEELRGPTDILDFIHPDDRAGIDAALSELWRTGRHLSLEYRIVRPDGEIRWIADHGFAVRGPTGRVQRIGGLAEDITERRRQEEERRQLEAQIQQSQKLESLGVLAGGIAHDFNNLLMGVLGNADLALASLSTESPGREAIDRIRVAAERASELADQMLAYSGRGRVQIDALDVNRLVEEMSHLLSSAISKKTSLSLDLTAGLPAVEADASQIRQVVMNLITNASEAIGDQGGLIRLATSHREFGRAEMDSCVIGSDLPDGGYVCIEVADPGCGMNETERAKIFDPFFTTKFKGRGLGLAAVVGIVRRHGGALLLDSEVGRGTTFSILLPCSSGEAAEPAEEGAQLMLSGTGTVLVVDDEESVRRVTRAMLENIGYRVRTAADGPEGVEAYREHGHEIAAVLLDLTMPGLDGGQVYKELTRINPAVRVVLASGYSEGDAVEQLASEGVRHFLHKPYRLDALREALAAVLAEK